MHACFNGLMISPTSFNFGKVVPHLKTGRSMNGIVPLTQTPGSWVYRLQKDGQPCILRISTQTLARDDGLTSAEGTAYRVEALKRGQTLKGFEQLIDYSTEHKAVLTHEAPGKPFPELTTPEVRTIRPRHLQVVARAIGEGVLRDIRIDADSSNMFFHPRRGITIIDYGLANEANKPSAQKEYTAFLQGIGDSIVAPIDTAEYQTAWSKTFEDGLTVLHQTFGVEPDMVSPRLLLCQRDLRE